MAKSPYLWHVEVCAEAAAMNISELIVAGMGAAP